MTDNNYTQAGESQKEMGALEKIMNVFFAPRKTFESVDRKPDWLIPMVIVVIVSLVFTIIAMPIIMPEQMAKQREKMEEKGMTNEQIEKAQEMGAKVGKFVGPISSIVVVVVVLLVISGIYLFAGNIVLGGKTIFKKVLAVVCYSSLIGSLGQLILLPLVMTKKTMSVSFSLASFMSPDASETALYHILKHIDLFAFWQIIVAGIGIAVIYKFTTKKSIIMVASLYVIYILISLGVKSIF